MKELLNCRSEMEYYDYLKGLDDKALLDEFYSCHRLKKAIASRVDRVCRTTFNYYCPRLVNVPRDEIIEYDHYLIRLLLRLEFFVKKESQHITELHEFYDPRPIRIIKPPTHLSPDSFFALYSDIMKEIKRLEKMISSMEEKTNAWMYFLYNKRNIPDSLKTQEYRQKMCAVKPDGSYDYDYQRELVYKGLVEIIETEMNCNVQKFMDKSCWI